MIDSLEKVPDEIVPQIPDLVVDGQNPDVLETRAYAYATIGEDGLTPRQLALQLLADQQGMHTPDKPVALLDEGEKAV